MPIFIPVLPPVTPQPTTPSAPPASSPNDPSQSFGNVLAQASNTRTSPADRAVAGQPADDFGIPADEELDDTDDVVVVDPTQLAAQAAAGLLVVAPGVTLSSSGSPVSVDENAGTTAATRAPTEQLPTDVADTLSRAEQFRLRLAAAPQALPQAVTTQNTRSTQPTLPTAQQALTPATPEVPSTVPNLPTTSATNALAAASNPVPSTGLPAGVRPVVPAAAPMVADLLPPTAVPAATEPGAAPVAAPVAPSGLPDVQVGDRPTMAGERFAALASQGAQLAASRDVQPADTAFAAALANASDTPAVAPPTTPPVETTPTAPVVTAARSAVPAVMADETIAAPASQTVQPLAAPEFAVNGPTIAPPTQTVSAAAPLVDGQALAGAGPRLTNTDGFSLNGWAAQAFRNGTNGNGLAGNGAFANVFRERFSLAADGSQPADTTTANGSAAAAFTVPTTTTPTSTAPAAPTTPAAATPPTAAAQLADGVVAHAHTLNHNGTVEFRMRLDPPELGRLQVHLISDGDSIRGQVMVADDTVRRVIESQLPELRQRLEQAGMSVQRFDITTDPGTGGSGNPYRGNSSSPDRNPFAQAASTTATQPTPRTPTGRTHAGRIDVTA